MDALIHQEKDDDRGDTLAEREQLDDLERALDEMAERARDLARDALTAAGYYQHKRGEWRKRRVSTNCAYEARRANNGYRGGEQAD